MKTLLPANKPAQDFTCLLQELRQPDSRAIHSWDEADRIRESIESDSRPLPATPAPRRHLNFKFEKPVSFSKQLSQSNSASRNWHQKKALEFKAAGLNWRGEPYRNARRTRPLVNPDLPPKLYLDHAAYMAAWRAKRKAAK
jgi:hypothetical protein